MPPTTLVLEAARKVSRVGWVALPSGATADNRLGASCRNTLPPHLRRPVHASGRRCARKAGRATCSGSGIRGGRQLRAGLTQQLWPAASHVSCAKSVQLACQGRRSSRPTRLAHCLPQARPKPAGWRRQLQRCGAPAALPRVCWQHRRPIPCWPPSGVGWQPRRVRPRKRAPREARPRSGTLTGMSGPGALGQ